MKIVVRVDASTAIGTGHQFRCMTIARWLRQRGAQVRFVCRAHGGHLIELLRQERMPVTVLPAPEPAGPGAGSGHAAWLGTSQAEDARQTIEVLREEVPDWLLVDHYALDIEWEQRVRGHARQLMVIDDLADRSHDCDVLLDQNYSTAGERRYAGRVPGTCRLLAGPRYALLRPEYAQARQTVRARDGRVERVLVFFGGSDPADMTRRSVQALAGPRLRHLAVDVVAGANHPSREALEALARDRPGTTLHGPLPHLADLIAGADVALGAGGATTWERMCLGLPSILVAVAANQRGGCEALAAAGLVEYAGAAGDVSVRDLQGLLERLVQDRDRLGRMAQANRLLVDGLGTPRVAQVLWPSGVDELRLRPAKQEDVELYYGWVNDEQVRRSAIDPAPIAWETHQRWFARKLLDPGSHLFVLEADGLPVGQVRFDLEASAARIDYSLDAAVRGRGWGRVLVAAGLREMARRGSARFRAEVKRANGPSCAIFLGLGFEEQAAQPPADLRRFHLDLPASGWREEHP